MSTTEEFITLEHQWLLQINPGMVTLLKLTDECMHMYIFLSVQVSECERKRGRR